MKLVEDFDAGKVGHADVEQDEVGGFLARARGGRGPWTTDSASKTRIPTLRTSGGQTPRDEAFVVDGQDFFADIGKWMSFV